MERAPRRVADAPVGLENAFARLKKLLHFPGKDGQDLREQGLAVFAEGQGVSVPREPVDEILSKVRTPGHA